MVFKEIVELINMIDKSQISLLELKRDNFYFKLDKSSIRNSSTTNEIEKSNSVNTNTSTNIVTDIKEDNSSSSAELDSKEVPLVVEDDKAQYITSPMVGTVYLAPSPGKKEYVSEGQSIQKGDVVCIVEAMKLMNEIESEVSGKLVEVLVKNGQMVEFGQKLFKIL